MRLKCIAVVEHVCCKAANPRETSEFAPQSFRLCIELTINNMLRQQVRRWLRLNRCNGENGCHHMTCFLGEQEHTTKALQ